MTANTATSLGQACMDIDELLMNYRTGPALLDSSLEAVSAEDLDRVPEAGGWTIREIVLHLADAELVYADRIKRVLAEENPTVMEWAPEHCEHPVLRHGRTLESDCDVIRVVREHVSAVLSGADLEDWQRTAVHSEEGPMTLETLVERITGHIPHHVAFLDRKRRAFADFR